MTGSAPAADNPGRGIQRTKSAEDFAMAFGDVELHLNSSDEIMPISGPGPTHEDLTEFSVFWGNTGLPPKVPTGWNKPHEYQQHYPPQQQIQQQQQQNAHPFQQRLMVSGATSPTEIGTETGTQASESWAGTATAADDIVSTLSNDTDDCDTASRSSLKRRRMTATNSSSSFGFQPLARVKESGDAAGGGNDNNSCDADVRAWRVDIPDHDVVLGDTHEPTWGTKIYREVRKPYAKKTMTNEQIKVIKAEFQRRLEKELGKKLPCPPRFWCNKESHAKVKQFPVSGFLKSRPGIMYAYAKDQAIKDDIKNASARSRTRATKHFNFKGSLDEVAEKAMEACEAWVGDDIDKELYAKGFKEDVERMLPWRGEYLKRQEMSEQQAVREPVLQKTHMREAKIHETHASHLEIVMVDMINQLGNMMIEAHRADARRTKPLDAQSMGDSSVGHCSRNSRARSSMQEAAPVKGTLARKAPPVRPSSSMSSFQDEMFKDMDLSPIQIQKPGALSEKLEADAAAAARADPRRKDLSRMFSQTLRMSSLEDLGGASASAVSANVAGVVVMPPGLPREVPRGNAVDELSVLSVPDDASLLLDARDSAIRRGIDQPAALPQPGHVADRTKALLQQMKRPASDMKK